MSGSGESRAEVFGDARTEDEAQTKTPNSSALEARIAALEGAAAEFQTGRAKANDELLAYVGDLRRYLRHTNWIRWSVLAFSAAYISIINILLGYIIFFDKLYFTLLGSYTRVAFIFAAVSSSIGLFIAVLRGTLKSSAERHKENHTLSELRQLFNMAGSPKSD